MALLLAMYQKFRLIREKNELVLKQASYSSKLTRIEKNIEKAQKRYTSLFAQLDQQANAFKNNAKMQFQNMFGLGVNSFQPYNYSGVTENIYNNVGQMMTQGGWFKYKDENKAEQKLPGISNERYAAMMGLYQQFGSIPAVYKKDANGNNTNEVEYYGNEDNQFNKMEVAAFNQAMQQARAIQSQQQMTVQNLTTNYENNVSIWLDAQKAQLEAEQDATMDALTYEQTMMELSKTQADSRLKRIQTELESYEQLASQEAEKTAPTFGLR